MSATEIWGLTGGIGSGKSTAAACFAAQGVPVFDADAYSRAALEPGTACYEKTAALFGPDCLNPDGTINRPYVAQRIFSDEAMRRALNGVIHPYVHEQLRAATARAEAPLVVWEVPLLFESGFDRFCTRTIAVLCDEAIRADRVSARDGAAREQVYARMRAQITDAERKLLADVCLSNEGTPDELNGQVLALLKARKERP